jgi:V/A-type H+-transporting ATPase subunit I
MIVEMKKVFVAARASDREALLAALGELGVIHLDPVRKAAAPEELAAKLATLRQARQELAGVTPGVVKPEVDVMAAAGEVVEIARRSAQARDRLNALGREADRLSLWGEVRREQFDALAEAGVPLRFFTVSQADVEQVRAELVVPLAGGSGRRSLVALVQREGEPELPESAEEAPLPQRDLPTVRAEAAELESALQADARLLARLANLEEAMAAEQRRLEAEAELAEVRRGGLSEGDLFAVRGWVPAEAADRLADDLAERGLAVAVRMDEPDCDEQPPTLIRYPRWARPIKGLFDMLGTNPGYREMDLSPFFMLALPLFAAMLIGDGGYGLLLLVLPLLFRKKLIQAAGPEKTNLLTAFGACALVWGVLTANYFGVTPNDLASAAGRSDVRAFLDSNA